MDVRGEIMYHRCKTTTITEVVLDDERTIDKRAKLKRALEPYTMNRTFQNLLQGDYCAQLSFFDSSFCIPMKRSLLGLYLIPVKIGQTYYHFVLDSGAQISGIHPAIAKAHHAQKLPGTLSIGSVGGKEKAMAGYMLEEVHIGALTIRHFPVVALSPSQFQINIAQYEWHLLDGILGWDILSQLDFELDDVDGAFKVMENRYRFSYPNMVKTTFPLFLMKDGKGNLCTMGFDSGARNSWMNKDAMQAYGYSLSKETNMLGYGVHGLEEMKVRLISEMELNLYKANIRLKNVVTGRTDIFPSVTFDGIVGNEIFRHRRIRLINSKEMVLIA